MVSEELEKWMRSVETRLQTINERTKTHTLDIRKLRKELKDDIKR